MEIPCSVIEDLLPSYIEQLCSEETSKIIKEHVKNCESCRGHYETMCEPLDTKKMVRKQKISKGNPFGKIKRKHRIQIILAVLFTAGFVTVGGYMISNIGILSDIFYPEYMAAVSCGDKSANWERVLFDTDYLIYDSIFYRKYVVNDANSSSDIVMRIKDKDGNIIIEPFTIQSGVGEKLDLKWNQEYIVEICAEPGKYFIHFR